VNFLIATISPNSNPEEFAVPNSLAPVDDSIEIWLAESVRVSRTPWPQKAITLPHAKVAQEMRWRLSLGETGIESQRSRQYLVNSWLGIGMILCMVL
jgi:hypothetical protein